MMLGTYAMKSYSAIRKDKILPFATIWIILESIVLREVSQKEKDKSHMVSFACGI